MKQPPIVRDYMDKKVYTLVPETEVRKAIRFLLKHRVTGAPVVDPDGKLLGMFTEKDCMKLIATGIEGEHPAGRIEDFMTTDVKTIEPDMNIYYVAGLFLNHTFRRFPVIEDGKLIGAITRFDILRVIEPELS